MGIITNNVDFDGFDRATLHHKPTEEQLARYKASKKRLDEIDTKALLEDIRAFLTALAENDNHAAWSLRARMDALELGW
jgi:predicted nucleotidyltransferase